MERQTRMEAMRVALEAERAGVERHLTDLGAAVERNGVDLPVDEGGFADSAQATAERSEVLSLIESLQAQHGDLSAALTRVADGTYGKCERCGNEIPIERLEAVPTATLCVGCKQSAA